MKPVHSGRMRFLVTFQVSTDSTDSVGEPVESWATMTNGSRWADVEPVSGREFQSVQQIAAETTHIVRTRYLSGVTPKHRILWGSRVFDILAVRNLEERGRVTELLCRERL